MDDEERYVTVDLSVLAAIREVAATRPVDRPAIRLVLPVARIDPVTNNLVIGVRVARDLGDPPLVTRPHDWPHDQ